MRSRSLSRYHAGKFRAKQRNIQFLLTFNEWDNWWLSHGIDKDIKQGPLTANTLCMCRSNDSGPYALNNIYCDTQANNARDAHKFNPMGLSRLSKKLMTPAGLFDSKKQATAYYGVDRTTMARWIKQTKSESFYYI